MKVMTPEVLESLDQFLPLIDAFLIYERDVDSII